MKILNFTWFLSKGGLTEKMFSLNPSRRVSKRSIPVRVWIDERPSYTLTLSVVGGSYLHGFEVILIGNTNMFSGLFLLVFSGFVFETASEIF